MKRLLCAAALLAPALACAAGIAIITQDHVALRPAPRESAKAHAALWQGEAVEVRGEKLDYLQVYDHRRERAGFVRASQARRFELKPGEAPELLAILRFLRGSPGAESLGIGIAAAYIQAAPAEILQGEAGAEALDALGTFAERLAARASSGAPQSKAAQAALSGHLDAAARHGVKFLTQERAGRLQVCYEGDAYRRVLAMRSTPEQRARAVLGLTRPECMADSGPLERRQQDEWRSEVLDRVDADALPGWLMNRVLMRRAAVWSSLAWQRARQGDAPEGAAARSIAALSAVRKSELTDEDAQSYNFAAMRTNASRWAMVSVPAEADRKRPHIVTLPGAAGETCVLLVDAKNGPSQPLARRCTYGLVWGASATLNREGTALALAVQPTDAWREMWLFRKTRGAWSVSVLPPAPLAPGVGYAEFAGWVPGGSQVLVAREAAGEGRYKRSFEVLGLDTLVAARQAEEPGVLGAFQRWQDPGWKRMTVSLR